MTPPDASKAEHTKGLALPLTADLGVIFDANKRYVGECNKVYDAAFICAAANRAPAYDAMLAALQECEAYLEDREDVVDGSYGEPAPNKEMTLLIEVRAALKKANEGSGG